jgi:uncharacterized protein
VSEHSDQDFLMISVKVVISGGFGVGKTTFIGSISEIEPLATEAEITDKSVGVDDLRGVDGKTTTTVALDFGRISLDEALRLYLFGTPGQDRFTFMWDDLVEGALGAVVLLDTRRIDDCFIAIDYFEEHRVPFLVGVNVFEGTARFDLDEVREALGIGAEVPMVECDARNRGSVKGVLVALTEQVLTRRLAELDEVGIR